MYPRLTHAHETLSGSFNHCDSCLVVGNHVGPAGLPAPDGTFLTTHLQSTYGILICILNDFFLLGPWADGLSIACRNGIVVSLSHLTIFPDFLPNGSNAHSVEGVSRPITRL